MTWHTTTVPTDGLPTLLARIRATGGTVACSRPGDEGVRVTWTTTVDRTARDAGTATRG